LSFVGLPFTLLSGPVLTYNLFTVAGPVLSAGMAYLLCLHITRVPSAALIGGALFGFSSYEMGQDLAPLNLSFTVFVPALLLVTLLRLENRLNRLRFILAAGILLICQFVTCIEIFGLIFVFGGVTWLLALLYLAERRGVVARLFTDGLATAPLVILAVSPLLVSMAVHADAVHLPAAWPYYFTADFLNVFIPNRNNLIGGSLFTGISQNFKGGPQEQDAYIGLPLLTIIILFARAQRHAPMGRFLLAILLFLLLCSFGPRLWVDGRYSDIVLPWMIFVHVPLVSSALPARFALFLSLVVAVIAALWVASPAPQLQRRWRLGLGLLAIVFLLPKPHPATPVPASVFFQPGHVSAVLGPNPRILVLPFAINGPSSLWQAQSGFGFLQTGGYLGFPPAGMQHFAAVGQLFGNFEGPDFLDDFRAFCAGTKTQYVAAGPGTSAALWTALAQLNWPARQIDDVTIFTVPAAAAPHG
jgi:hypothetical protein